MQNISRFFLKNFLIDIVSNFILLLSVGNIHAQTFCITVGGVSNDLAQSVIQTSDGGYVVAGYTESSGLGGDDIYVVRMDRYGNVLWKKTYGGSKDDWAYSVIQTSDGNFTVAGYTNSYNFDTSDANFYLLKIDTSGNILWSKIVGLANEEYGRSIIQTTDSGCFISGYTISSVPGEYGQFYMVKLDGNGTITWTKKAGGTNYDFGYSGIQTTDGGYVAAGYSNSFTGNGDFYIVRLNESGNILWTKTAGGSNSDDAKSIIRAADGGFAIGGFTNSFGAGGYDFYMVKFDSGGTIQWTTTVGGSGDEDSYYGMQLIQTQDGGYAMAGRTNSFGAGGTDFYLVKLNSSGNFLWGKTAGGSGNEDCHALTQSGDGGYILAGETNYFGEGGYDFFIVKLDSNGNGCCTSDSGGIAGTGGIVTDVISAIDSGGGVLTGGTTGTIGNSNILCRVIGMPEPDIPLTEFLIIPAVSSGKIRILNTGYGSFVLKISDITGREVLSTKVIEQSVSIALPLPSGIYFAKLKPENLPCSAFIQKIVIIR